MKYEVQLEFGHIKSDGFEDLYWYNEGEVNEIWYFIKHYIKKLRQKNMYFKIRFDETPMNLFVGRTLYLRNKRNKK